MFYKIAKTLSVTASIIGILMMAGACSVKSQELFYLYAALGITTHYYRSICTGIFPDTGMAVQEKENKGGEGTCRKRSSVRSGFGWRS